MTVPASPNPTSPTGDERNVVAVDPSAPQATFEERLTGFWERNRTLIVVALALVVVGIVGRWFWEQRQAAEQEEIRQAFGRLDSTEARLAFAREHEGHPLAGVALLGAADGAYEKAEYAEAASRYAQAVGVLKDPVAVARARLGEAISNLQAGMSTKGEEGLRSVGGDTAAPISIRAEAWYHLGALQKDAGDVEGARAALAKVSEIAPESLWAMRADGLASKLPPAAPTSAPAP